MKKKLRLWAIRSGMIKPRNITETIEAFPFPVCKNIEKSKHPVLFWNNALTRVL